MTPLRVAVVGCGKIADQHMAAIQRIPFATVVAACDQEPLMAEQLAERFRVRHSSANVSQLLIDVRPDIVHITTPPQSHFALARQCLEAGCHVYVEKPFTVNADEAMRLVQLASERHLSLTAGHNLQFTWENIDARSLVAAGFLGGPPIHIDSYYTYNFGDVGYAKALLGDMHHWVRRLPGKLLHNIISHGIARIAEFMEADAPLVSAFGHTSPLLRSIGETDIVDELRVHVTNGNNMTASFVFSSQLKPVMSGYRLYGPRNSLIVDNVHHVLIRERSHDYKSYLNYFAPPLRAAYEQLCNVNRNIGRFLRADFHDDSGLKRLIESFYFCVLGKAPLPISYRELILTSRIMDSIFSQLTAQTAGTATVGRGMQRVRV